MYNYNSCIQSFHLTHLHYIIFNQLILRVWHTSKGRFHTQIPNPVPFVTCVSSNCTGHLFYEIVVIFGTLRFELPSVLTLYTKHNQWHITCIVQSLWFTCIIKSRIVNSHTVPHKATKNNCSITKLQTTKHATYKFIRHFSNNGTDRNYLVLRYV